MIIMIDNYDSFTYNLVQALSVFGADIHVYRNDAVSVADLESMNPSALVISPGPCTPREAGISVALVRKSSGKLPILGVCLGHQVIAEAFGAKISRAALIKHGKTSMIEFDDSPLYTGIKSPSPGGRYHSLVVEKGSCPSELVVDATSDDGEIMGIHHRAHPTYGIQFHPESILTPCGKRMLRNFLKIVENGSREAGAMTQTEERERKG